MGSWAHWYYVDAEKLEVSQEDSTKVMLSSEGWLAISPQAEAYLPKMEETEGLDLITSVVHGPHTCSYAMIPPTSSVTPSSIDI